MNAAELYAAELADNERLGLKFTVDWWTRGGHNLVAWMKHVVPRYAGKPDVMFLEIGSFEGRSAIWMARNVLTGPGVLLTCVDVFHPSYAYTFDVNVRKAGVDPRVQREARSSELWLHGKRPQHFDLIYIDGAHDPPSVLMDAVMSWSLLKPGGLLVFDDYPLDLRAQGKSDYPKPAIDAFLNVYAPKLRVLEKDWQVFVEKVA